MQHKTIKKIIEFAKQNNLMNKPFREVYALYLKQITLILFLLLTCSTFAQQSIKSTAIKINATTYKQAPKISKTTDSTTYIPTELTYEDRKGIKYQIYLHKVTRGENADKYFYYIKKHSAKTNKEYWQKLNDLFPEDTK